MKVETLTESQSQRWNDIVNSHPWGTIFHRWEWLKIAERHTKSQLHPLVVVGEGGQPVGIFPLFSLRKGPFKMVFSPPPGTAIPCLGPLILGYDQLKPHKGEHLYQEFLEQVEIYIKSKLHPHYISITTPPGLMDIRPFLWANYTVKPVYTYVIDLKLGEEAVWDDFAWKLRSHIKRRQDRLLINEGTQADLEYIYRSVRTRYKEQKRSLPYSLGYLYDLFHIFSPAHLKVFTAYQEEQLVGGLVLIAFKKTVSVWVGVSKSSISGLPVNDILQWETIKWAIQQGYRVYELMGANTPQLCEFKAKYSPRLEIHFVAQKRSFWAGLAEKAYLRLRAKRE